MELQGTVKKIGETQTFGSGFQKREMVLLTNEQYPQPISIEFLSDKTDLLDYHKEGDNVKVGINIRGREWTSPQGEVKYFNSIIGWRMENNGENSTNTENSQPQEKTPTPSPSDSFTENPFEDEDSALPF